MNNQIESVEESAAAPAMARAVEAILQQIRILSELRSAGLGVVVWWDQGGLVAGTVAGPLRNWPTFEARIHSERWWTEMGADESRIATRLAAEMRMKWDRWIRGCD